MYEEILDRVKVVENGFKEIEKEALVLVKNNTIEESFNLGKEFYLSEIYQVRELGVFIFGEIAWKKNEALVLLKEEVSLDENWRVQEILAKAFDKYCYCVGYEKTLPIIKDWLKSDRANVRRAVTEGLRIWTGRDYFRNHPKVAVDLLSELKEDESEYVRKSVGNALRDISKKHTSLIIEELKTWDISNNHINQVYKLANKYIKDRRI
ncbi:DNA alkylation repair protein [Clostridium intestinale]|uniref:DNA alkylation repair enzyme n=1 Tax=Clostridium intestinale DSM 6191 TaxID=1121320 RepID=A0A1M6CNQ3_9CLOT|nr:DNA alkylation repair protein [Clostridium intestinale]SHI62636.1 DNA alkylation repair enzyme [Clostridium intestinale DSM 6191]